MLITWHRELTYNRYCRAVTILNFHCTIIVAKRFHKNNIMVISKKKKIEVKKSKFIFNYLVFSAVWPMHQHLESLNHCILL